MNEYTVYITRSERDEEMQIAAKNPTKAAKIALHDLLTYRTTGAGAIYDIYVTKNGEKTSIIFDPADLI